MKETMKAVGGKQARIEFYLKPERENEGIVSIKAYADGHVHVYGSSADMSWQDLVSWLTTVLREIASYYAP